MTTDEVLHRLYKMTHDALTGTLQVSSLRGHYMVEKDDITALYEAMDIIKEKTEPGNHGHWLLDNEGTGYFCDDCGAWHRVESKYCPCCGREMEVPDVGVSD